MKKHCANPAKLHHTITKALSDLKNDNPALHNCIQTWGKDSKLVIGRGGFSMVLREGASASVRKVFSRNTGGYKEGGFRDKVTQEAKMQELAAQGSERVAAKVNSLVFLQGVGSDYAMLSMDFVPGRPLSDCCRREYHNQNNVEVLLKDISKLLEWCLTQKIVFGDLKPENLMASLKDNLFSKITAIDFGGAQMVGKSLTGYSFSPEYMSPERLVTPWMKANHKIDSFAVGRVLIDYFVGTHLEPTTLQRNRAPIDLDGLLFIMGECYEGLKESGTAFTKKNQKEVRETLLLMGYSEPRCKRLMQLLIDLNKLSARERLSVDDFITAVRGLDQLESEIPVPKIAQTEQVEGLEREAETKKMEDSQQVSNRRFFAFLMLAGLGVAMLR